MYIAPIAWIYVALMMAVAEATNSNGSVLGAIITFLLYGAAPVALMMYFMGTPGRKRAIKAREAIEAIEAIEVTKASEARKTQGPSGEPDAGGHAPAAAELEVIPPVRKEP